MVASCWCDVDCCQFFGAICEALGGGGADELADFMRRPFTQDGPALRDTFDQVGFVEVTLFEQSMPLVFESIRAGVDAAYATPIGPRLRELTEEAQPASTVEDAIRR